MSLTELVKDSQSPLHNTEVTSGGWQYPHWNPSLSWHSSDLRHGYACAFQTTARSGSIWLVLTACAQNQLSRYLRGLIREIGLHKLLRETPASSHSPITFTNPMFLRHSTVKCGEAQCLQFKRKKETLAKEMSLWLGSKTFRSTLISFSFWYPSFSSSL